jgi:hypothetical protein
MKSALYLTCTGILEPLGQSQTVSYLRGLAHDHGITLVTFEKPEDRSNKGARAGAWADCEAHNIDLRHHPFRRQPRFLAPAWTLLTMNASALCLARSKDISNS